LIEPLVLTELIKGKLDAANLDKLQILSMDDVQTVYLLILRIADIK